MLTAERPDGNACFCFRSCVQAFNPDNEYHFKNRMKTCQRNWAEVFGDEANMFAISPSNSYQKVSIHPSIYVVHKTVLQLMDTRPYKSLFVVTSHMCCRGNVV